MTTTNFGRSDYFRRIAREGRITLRNRFFEVNPVLATEDKSGFIARPGTRRWIEVGSGPVRKVFNEAGAFENDLFVVSSDELYRVTIAADVTLIGSGLFGAFTGGGISMAATANIGSTPEFLYLADGRNLWLYVANGYAEGVLTGTPANGDVVQLGSMYYEFTNASVDAGTPDGTVTNPWLVALGTGAPEAFTNLKNATVTEGVAGTDYSSVTQDNPDAFAYASSDNTISARALGIGVAGNSVATTETGAALAWTAATLTGGGDPSFTTVETPDNIGAVSVGYIGGYVIVVPAQGEGINGRFWWIEPGETTIDPLNFATAERSPDPINEVIIFSDQFWLPGLTTTETWYLTGDPEAPVLRLQGITFDSGAWEGTAVKVRDVMIIVDPDGGVYKIGGGIEKVSDPSIEARIRRAIANSTV